MKTAAHAAEGFAHGRVNLIGEHTDYNGGWVLPTAIPQRTVASLTPRADDRVTIEAGHDPKSGANRRAEYVLGQETSGRDWTDYVQGVTFVLRQAGHPLTGFDLRISSDVPEGSGLSSSAALEIAVLKAIRASQSLDISDVEIARLGQRVENDFVGARVGIMDQMACSFARAGEALFLDTLELKHRNVRIPVDRVELVVINSGVRHSLAAGGGYNQRRAECEMACEKLGVTSLRELSIADLARTEKLPEPFRRRAKHVITENARVHDAVAALESGDFIRLGKLFDESHASMRDDYEVSVPEIDRLVEAARGVSGVYGARLTGGGFGGSIVALVPAGSGKRAGVEILAKYREEAPGFGTLLVPQSDA
jgi:galactokinase